MFQFQYGTIKRRYEYRRPPSICSFNSNMVRLKVTGEIPVPYRDGFQFQYGTIKSRHQTREKITYSSFNSNMVRLKVKIQSIRGGDSLVSIPIWYD